MGEGIKKRILVVDDNPQSRKLLEGILGQAGYEVVVVEGGDEAIEHLSIKQNFALIITDIMMPYMSGIELVEKLKTYKETKNIPILGISAYLSEKGDLEDDFLAKPIKADLLLKKVRGLI
jgi:CheY-like chemotaxis protein